MYNNVGAQIKSVGVVFAVFLGIMSFIAGVSCFFLGAIGVIIGLFVMFIGIFMAWVTSIFIYGFGQLVENSDKLVEMNTKKLSSNINTQNFVRPDPVSNMMAAQKEIVVQPQKNAQSKKETAKPINNTKNEKVTNNYVFNEEATISIPEGKKQCPICFEIVDEDSIKCSKCDFEF